MLFELFEGGCVDAVDGGDAVADLFAEALGAFGAGVGEGFAGGDAGGGDLVGEDGQGVTGDADEADEDDGGDGEGKDDDAYDAAGFEEAGETGFLGGFAPSWRG